jgi:hypothetical protein
MVAVHSYPDASFKAGTGVNTTTAIYKAVYLSDDNTVSILNTTTNLGKFIGILQDYANTTGASVPVRLAGPSKAVLKGASITAGDLVGIAVGTSTALGHVMPSTGDIADPTAGACLIIGDCLMGSQGGTGTICEINIQKSFKSAVTSTYSN